MATLGIFAGAVAALCLGYVIYGRRLADRLFGLDAAAPVPSRELEDGHDFVPTPRGVVFGHHFTSIAGTGPIVGPAIAVFWGWLPAVLWIVLGAIFIGAVHDLSALVISLRSRGQTIGEVARRLISPRARLLFLTILCMALTVVIGVFGLVIAVLFARYPETVIPIWIEIPVALWIGARIRKRGGDLLWPSLAALVFLYVATVVGVLLPVRLPLPTFAGAEAGLVSGLGSTVVLWTLVLLVYSYFASVLPVAALLQPRDYINAHQLYVGLALLVAGLIVAAPPLVAPAWSANPPADAPAMLPFLCITIACGAVSGFHCLVSSGTSSKQLASETDALPVGFGAMLLEAGLAVLVVLACSAGIGLGVAGPDGAVLQGEAAYAHYYGGSFGGMTLTKSVGAFVEGGAALLTALHIPLAFATGILAVMVASFASTTLDTATRLQRYVIQELAEATGVRPLTGAHGATLAAVVSGGVLALLPGPQGPGSGGLILWPLFGAVNQLLAGLAFLVAAFYLVRHGKSLLAIAPPLLLMVVLPAWAMTVNLFEWTARGDWHLVAMGVGMLVVEAAMLYEGVRLLPRACGVLPEPLPPLPARSS